MSNPDDHSETIVAYPNGEDRDQFFNKVYDIAQEQGVMATNAPLEGGVRLSGPTTNATMAKILAS